MTDRQRDLALFLAENGWQNARKHVLAGDASARQYLRLQHPQGQRVILMDAPPQTAGSITPFVNIAQWLSDIGLSAPKIYAADSVKGFMLLEDFGDALFAQLAQNDPGQETALYLAATDALLQVQSHPAPEGLHVYDPAKMAHFLDPLFTSYAPNLDPGFKSTAAGDIKAEMLQLMQRYTPMSDVVILRDYHAENLIWLPGRGPNQRTGLLDFQDALIGHRTYDLASLLDDARRDVSAQTRTAVIAHFASATNTPAQEIKRALAVQGAQRNMRILGVFAGLALNHGKPRYIDMMPRVWALLQNNLCHPDLTALQSLCLAHLPAPTPSALSQLRLACPTHPHP